MAIEQAGNLLVPTILAAAAYFVVALAGGAAVLWIASVSPKWMHLCNAVAGGVLIGVALCHMLGDNVDGMTAWGQAISAALGGDPDDSFPLGLALTGYGFFLVVGIEHLLGGHGHTDSHSHEDKAEQGRHQQPDAENQNDNPDVVVPVTSLSSQGDLKGRALDVSGVATFLGVAIHSTIEAIATGAAQSADAFGVLVFAVLLHKGFAAFAVAASLLGMRTRSVAMWWALVIAFACTGPVGIAIGAICRANVEGQGSALLQCLAAGTLLAVGIVEMLIPALDDVSVWKKRKLAAAIFGFSMMALLAVWA